MTEPKGYTDAKEAARRLGYDYTYLLKLLREGKVPGAQWWQGYLVPEDVERGDIRRGTPGRPKKS
jgi:hypothetical protein